MKIKENTRKVTESDKKKLLSTRNSFKPILDLSIRNKKIKNI